MYHSLSADDVIVTGNEAESWYYGNQTLDRRAKFNDIFWNDSLSLWRDRRKSNVDNSFRGNFYASSFTPLIWRCGQGGIEQDEKFLSTLNSLGVLDYPGGVPTSLWKNSTQQWDFPNVWAPLQWMLVLAWHDSPSAVLRAAAEKVARTWLTTTYLAWEKHNHTMFEKVRIDMRIHNCCVWWNNTLTFNLCMSMHE